MGWCLVRQVGRNERRGRGGRGGGGGESEEENSGEEGDDKEHPPLNHARAQLEGIALSHHGMVELVMPDASRSWYECRRENAQVGSEICGWGTRLRFETGRRHGGETRERRKGANAESIDASLALEVFDKGLVGILRCAMSLSLLDSSPCSALCITRPTSILLSGPCGAGKTTLVSCLAHQLGLRVVPLLSHHAFAGTRLSPCGAKGGHEWGKGERTDAQGALTVQGALDECLDEARRAGRSIVLVEQGERLLGVGADADRGLRTRLLGLIQGGSGGAEDELDGLLVVVECSDASMLDQAVRSKFPDEFEIGIPTAAQRLFAARSHALALNMLHEECCNPEAQDVEQEDAMAVVVERASESMHGFLPGDVAQAFRLASLDQAIMGGGSACTARALSLSVESIRPRALGRSEAVPVHGVKMEDIGGLEEAKRALHEMLVLPTLEPSKYMAYGANPPRGLLLYGPPGTGKTLLAKAVAGEAGVSFIPLDISEIVQSGVGDSERILAAAFAKAASASPCMLFLDELQAVFGKPDDDDDSSSSSSQLLSQLMLEMDALKHVQGVFVLAATNVISMLDKRLLRPGRFDCVVHVGNPTEEARASILKRSMQLLPIKTCSCVGCSPSCDQRSQGAVDEFAQGLAARTGGMSGAELVHVCRLAAMNAMRRDAKATQIETRDFNEVLISWRRGDYNESVGNV